MSIYTHLARIREYASNDSILYSYHAEDRSSERYIHKRHIKQTIMEGILENNGDGTFTITKWIGCGHHNKAYYKHTVVLSYNIEKEVVIVITAYTDKDKTLPTIPIRIRCVETGQEFPSIQQAERELNLNRGAITKYFRLKRDNKPQRLDLNFEKIK